MKAARRSFYAISLRRYFETVRARPDGCRISSAPKNTNCLVTCANAIFDSCSHPVKNAGQVLILRALCPFPASLAAAVSRPLYLSAGHLIRLPRSVWCECVRRFPQRSPRRAAQNYDASCAQCCKVVAARGHAVSYDRHVRSATR